ncbi:uncharacterized protein LOC129598826 [Paramacrobiotus metropolitanus]|uniref:uncharacterized protein LOC129598826 n=1 Tax=Paramacrobiotus metropolitanus TaxID=2943436 RepID=UPI0024464CD3|nr:uncharacterized protein LOC129598826 [Paramacrobiotus metropolitanus]XP_055352873.1 uncharacterized protein LOC129598826 [Paramacrobiotus metropolitanus]XP_055352874.1 uncharacterized protein LOC129598826 [Paramacrobiotus metropolitanus]XP_055352875.1 uncharacterized protein LOC129598826 [Paramacrobiotus metropolitanus]XP_055352876.1 uncharacterized protein LOC129598826 [Paramacrobiotus metropolitanus]XP_055352877.1 uncharacterized protein LOC129598826 [Paramacrobiotus metropolitanus]
MAFVLTPIAEVEGKTTESGTLFELQDDSCTRKVYIRSKSWNNFKDFSSDLHIKGGSSAFSNMSNKVLAKLGEWYHQRYIEKCEDKEIPLKRQAVSHLGLQEDGVTFVFGPDIIFVPFEGGMVLADTDKCAYVWTPLSSVLIPRTVEVYQGKKKARLFAIIRQHLPLDVYYTFVLMCAHSWISMFYGVLIRHFKGLPSLIVVGLPDTWKTLLLNLSVSIFGTNMEDICNLGEITDSAGLDRWTKLHVPLIIHDNPFPKLMPRIFGCVYERKLYLNYRNKNSGGVHPTSSCALTMNSDGLDDIAAATKDKMRTLSRVAILTMDNEITDIDNTVFTLLEQAQQRASKDVRKLLHFGEEGCRELTNAVNDKYEIIKPKLLSAGMVSCTHRIATLYSILSSVGDMIARKVACEYDKEEALQCLLRHISKAAPYQTLPRNGLTARTTLSLLPDRSNCLAKESFAQLIEALRKTTHAEKMNTFFKNVLSVKFEDIAEDVLCLAVRKDLFLDATKEDPLQQNRWCIDQIAWADKQHQVNLKGVRRRCLILPREHFTSEQLAKIDGIVDALQVSLDEAPEVSLAGNPAAATCKARPHLDASQTSSGIGKRKSSAMEATESGTQNANMDQSLPANDSDFSPLSSSTPKKMTAKDRVRTGNKIRSFSASVVSEDDPEATKRAVHHRFGKLSQDDTNVSESSKIIKCGKCHVALIPDNKDKPWLRCTVCQHAFHHMCASYVSPRVTRSGKPPPKQKPWKCPYCSKR